MASPAASSAEADIDVDGALEIEQLWPSDIITWPYVPRRWGAGVLHLGALAAVAEDSPATESPPALAELIVPDTDTEAQPVLDIEAPSRARRNPTRAAALAARARLEELGEPVRADAAEVPALPQGKRAGARPRATRWGRCVLCGLPLRPTLRVDGQAMLLCGKYRPGHTRRVLQPGTAEFDRLPDAMRGRAVRGS